MTHPDPHPGHKPRKRRMRHVRRNRRRERRRIAAVLSTETVGGALLVVAAIAALVVANSPLAHVYAEVRDWQIGPASMGLRLTIGEWTADGLLAIFFFLAGLELKHEFVAGQLRHPRRAMVPVFAAVGGMAAPAAVYLLVTAGQPELQAGWAIPIATDIAFALAVLAVVGRQLPGELRTFLLALAVVDDLLAIVVIAIFFTREVRFDFLAASLVAVVAFAVVIRRVRRRLVVRRTLLALCAIAAWVYMLRSGVHATVSGVLLGFAVPIVADRGREEKPKNEYDVSPGPGSDPHGLPLPAMAGRIDALLRPFSAAIAVPLFAFFAAGVTVGGGAGLASALGDRVALGVAAGLVIGKPLGIVATTFVVGRIVHSPLLKALEWPDWVGVAVLGGVGFTVSLLIGHLAFAGDAALVADTQVGVVTGSAVAAVAAAAILGWRSRHYAALAQQPG